MDNLYLFTDRDDGGALIANVSPQRSVWMTNIVCEGMRQNSTAFFLAGEQSKFYIGDSAVLNNKAAVPGILLSGGEAGNSVALRLRRVAFEGNAGTVLGAASVIVFQLALAAVENCTFSDDPTVLNILALNGTCGADDPTAYMASALSGGTFGPLSVLPSNLTFLTDEDADLLDIQQRSLEGRTPLGALADAPSPAYVGPVDPQSDGLQETTLQTVAGDDSDDTNVGAIAGGVAGAVVLLLAAGVLAFFITRKSRSAGTAKAPGNDLPKLDRSGIAMPQPSSPPAMHVGSLQHTFSSVPSGANGSYYGPGASPQMYSAHAQSHAGTPSWEFSGSARDAGWPNTSGSGGSGPPQPLYASPPAQQNSAWLHAPPPPGGHPTTIYQLPSTAGSGGGGGGAVANMLATQRPAPALADMLSAEARREQLERTLYSMATGQPQELFMGRFMLMQERRSGGQATVQFARGGDGGFFQYAIKFFNRLQDFAIEDGMFRQQAIKAVLPDLFASAANGDGAVRARSGFAFPPFLVMERGMTLAEWVQAPRDALAVLSMFKDCAALLATLHAAGHVHRDLKPDNVLLMLQTQAWRLIDFGIAAPAGKSMPPQCTLGYAAPEVIVAFDEKRNTEAAPAQDVWALGVMVFEAFTRKPAVDPLGGVDGCKAVARGEAQYPWEGGEQDREFGGSRARQLVESCLARDPAARPTAAALIEAITLISNRTEAVQ